MVSIKVVVRKILLELRKRILFYLSLMFVGLFYALQSCKALYQTLARVVWLAGPSGGGDLGTGRKARGFSLFMKIFRFKAFPFFFAVT